MRSTLATLPTEAPALAEALEAQGGREDALLVSIPMATHGDRDVSAFAGYDALVAGHADAEPGTIIKPMFCALLRRRSDGALRFVRYGLQPDGLVDEDRLVPHDVRSECHEAFRRHPKHMLRLVSHLLEDCVAAEAGDEDVKAHDDALAARLRLIIQRESKRFMDEARGAALKRCANDISVLQPRLGTAA